MLANNNIINVNTAKKRTWYFWAGLISIVSSSIIFTIMMALSRGRTQAFIFSKWYQSFLPISAFFAGHLSGATSLGRETDLLCDDEKKWTSEQWASLIGIGIGLTIGIGLLVVRSTLKFATAGISDILIEMLWGTAAVIGSVGAFCGLTSRLESTIVKPKLESKIGWLEWLAQFGSFINKKRKSILAGLTLGLITSLTLWFTGAAALTVVVGVTSFFTGGAAIPFWIAGGIFCLGYTATNASSFDYINKMQTFYQATLRKDKESEKVIEGKFHEYRGSAIGVTIGFVVAAAIVIALLVTQPYLVALVGAIAVTLVCTNTFGSLFSYLGSLIDIGQMKYQPALSETTTTTGRELTYNEPKTSSTINKKPTNNDSKMTFAKVSTALFSNPPAKQRETSSKPIMDKSMIIKNDKKSIKALIEKSRPATPKINQTISTHSQAQKGMRI